MLSQFISFQRHAVFYGAEVIEDENALIVSDNLNHEFHGKKVVSTSWLEECFSKQSLVPTSTYELK